ncbi:GTP-binding protein EngA (GTPase Der) [Psidium guajava]|nr:GTP-binding protein EngA (GTPase Der) [Psidium guajava]
MQGMRTFSLKGISLRRADLKHICLANARRVVFSRFTTDTQMEEHGYDSTNIADIQKAKGKSAAGSWLLCIADDTAYDIAKLMTHHNAAALVVKSRELKSIAGTISKRGSMLSGGFVNANLNSKSPKFTCSTRGFCTLFNIESLHTSPHVDVRRVNSDKFNLMHEKVQPVDFTKVDIDDLPTVIIVGRPNVGKSALFNRLIRRREALVYNTPEDHVTRDIREGIAKLSDIRFRVLDSAGLEMAASSGSILDRTATMLAKVLARSQFAIFLIDARVGLHPLDLEVGRWLRKHAPGMKPIVVMNKSESLDDDDGSLAVLAAEASRLGFGNPIAISAETGLGMAELYVALRPLLEDYMIDVLNDRDSASNEKSCSKSSEGEESKLPLQLAIVGRPNVGKSTLLNTLLQEERVLVGPEAGLTRDSIRAHFQFQGRTIYLVDTAGWLQRTKLEKGPSSLSIIQSRKNLMRAHVVALLLDAEEIAEAQRSMKHAEVVIARQAVEEGRGLVVIVNKMDVLRGKKNSTLYEEVMKAVPEEIQTLIPQVKSVPVVFISALEGRGRMAVIHQVVDTYEKWCLRLPTARLNHWLHKVLSRHSWKNQAAQPKIKYFTQVKARPPTFVAFVSGKTLLSNTDLRFLMRSLEEDFELGGIPIRIIQRSFLKRDGCNFRISSQSSSKMAERISSDKRAAAV